MVARTPTHTRKLHEALQILRLDIQSCGQTLVEAGTRMKERAELPTVDIFVQPSDLQRRLDSLRSSIKRLLEPLNLHDGVSVAEDSQTDALLAALDSLEKHHDRNARVAAVLEKVRRLRHRESTDRAVLELCGSEAAEVQHALDNGDPDPRLAEIAQGTHSLTQLVKLVEDLDALADEEFERLRRVVADSYGSKLARIVSRGALHMIPIEEPAARSERESEHATTRDPRVPPPEHRTAHQANGDDTTTGSLTVATADASRNLLRDTNTEPMRSETLDYQSGTAAGPHEPLAADVSPKTSASPIEPKDGEDHPLPAVPSSRTNEPMRLFVTAWELMEAGRLSLAFQLARTLEVLYPCTAPHLPSDVVRLVILSPLVQSSAGPLTDAIQSSLRRLAENLEQTKALPDPVRGPLELMIVCSSLRPALLAPATDAVSLLASLTVPADGLRRLQHAVMHHAELRLEITPSVLKGIREHAEWDKLVGAHCEAVGRWLLQNRHARIIYAPTTTIWRNWLTSSGPLGVALEAVMKDDRSAAALVRKTADKWSATSHIKDQVARTDRSLRGRLADRRPIDARALTSITSHAQQAVELIVGWLALLDGKPFEGGSRLKQVDNCRTEILAALGQAGHDVSALLSSLRGSVYARAAQVVIENNLSTLKGLFDPTITEAVPAPPADVVCGIDLLRIPAVSVNSDWEPSVGRTDALLRGIAATAGRPEADWSDVLDMKTRERDHRSTQKILDLLDTSGSLTDDEVDQLRSRRDRDHRQCIVWFRKEVDEVRAQIVRAASYDVLPEPTFLDLKGRIDSIQPEQTLVFQDAERGLAEVRQQLHEYDTRRIQQVRARLSTDLPDAGDDVKSTIHDALSHGNVAAANEHIDFAIQGRTIDMGAEDDIFAKFFPGFVKEINAFLGSDKKSPISTLINDLRGNKVVGPVDMRAVSGAQAADAARMLEAWFAAKDRKGPDVTRHLTNIFEGIGFESVRISGDPITRSAHLWWGELKVKPIADREICSVPYFGSSAQGRYRLLCSWDRPSEEELINASGRERTTTPLVVVYFGRMTETRRRDLAYLSRSRKKSLLVVDETVIWFLCAERGARLRRLFRAVLPFSTDDPYITTASLLPPEMFFGRADERKSIVDRFGTNLVYGGRQLGKTALLRDVERHFHRPNQGIIVRWLDLLAEHIGLTRPIEDIWPVIAEALQADRVTKSSSASRTVVKQVRTWIEEDETRRIVLLLDEADEFLRSDAEQQFKQLVQLKGLMDVTDRHFKVVFSGLHNVQRSSRDPNTQLAHLGQPICVGPLLKHDAAQAVALIRQPLSDLGYRFESNDLPMRILSHTNYYPSLIQIYCKHLLSHLTDRTRPLFDPKKSPPYLIRSEHLDAVQDEELREKILDKFKLTLDLDPRYRVIALCIALETLESRDRNCPPRGADPAWVREQALEWWPKGFGDDTSLEGFRTILDEMIGLGVVRKIDANTYTLRSPNLASLLGTQKEIEEELLDADERQPPAPYEALHFRRGITDSPTVRSPLTAQQEAELIAASNDVVVVCGSPLAEMDEIGRFLKLASPDCQCEVLETSRDVADVVDCMETFYARDARLSLAVVTSSCGWTNNWVEKTVARLRRKTSRKRFVRVVYVADPQQVWTWTASSSPRERLLSGGVRN